MIPGKTYSMAWEGRHVQAVMPAARGPVEIWIDGDTVGATEWDGEMLIGDSPVAEALLIALSQRINEGSPDEALPAPTGISRRDYFAVQVFQGLCASGKPPTSGVIADVVRAVDDLIAALDRRPQ